MSVQALLRGSIWTSGGRLSRVGHARRTQSECWSMLGAGGLKKCGGALKKPPVRALHDRELVTEHPDSQRRHERQCQCMSSRLSANTEDRAGVAWRMLVLFGEDT